MFFYHHITITIYFIRLLFKLSIVLEQTSKRKKQNV